MKTKAGKTKATRKRAGVKDLTAKKGGARGGIALLLPAVQGAQAAVPQGGVNAVMCDGSVRLVQNTISR